MNTIEIGKFISHARREAGYTQKSLAEALFVTDKAVSKWERGLCLPDATLLHKLSILLNVDIEQLVSRTVSCDTLEWTGELIVDDVRGMLAGKPLIHYLLSYFMLVGITDIAILTRDREYIRSLNLGQYGLNISFFKVNSPQKMVIDGRFFLFGVNITRCFQSCMASEKNISLSIGGERIPIRFSLANCDYLGGDIDNKSLPRGVIYIPLMDQEQIEDASLFVDLYEKYHKTKISDLSEIARLRGLT